MVMDVLVLTIFIFCIFMAMHKGFALTVISFCKCILSLVLGFLFCDDVRDFLLYKTPLGSWAASKLQERAQTSVSAGWENSDLYQALPELFKKQSADLTDSFVSTGTDKILNIVFGIVAFFLIVAAVSLVAFLFERLFSRKHVGGFVGFVDWLLGGIMGIVTGMFGVFLFLALVFPVVGFIMPNLADSLKTSLDGSYFAGDFYDNNLLLIIFRDFIN